MYVKLTALELQIVREPGTKPGRKHAYVDKVPELAERLYANGFAVDDYEAVLRKHAIKASDLSPDAYGCLFIEEMDAETTLALLTALVKKEEAVEGSFLAACVRSGLIEEIFSRLDAIDWENREIPEWIVEAVDKTLGALETFPWNKEITPYRAVAPCLEYVGDDGKTRVRALSDNDELDIVDELHRKAKDHGLYLGSSAYDNAEIGRFINIPFRVCRIEKGSDGPDTLMSFGITGPRWCESVSFTLKRYADHIEAICNPFKLGMSAQTVIEPSSEQLKLLKERLRAIDVVHWDESYWATVLDGWSWSLSVNLDGIAVESSGSNACPEGFDSLVSCITEIFGIADFEMMWVSIVDDSEPIITTDGPDWRMIE